MLTKQLRELERQADVVTVKPIKFQTIKSFIKSRCVDGFYYVGHLLDVDGNPWVDEEQLKVIIKKLNKK